MDSPEAMSRPSCRERWSDLIRERPRPAVAPGSSVLIGVLRGEGIGPEVVTASLDVLGAVASISAIEFATVEGGAIGMESRRESGKDLSDEVERFCEGVFADGGAVLAGPGGGRFVYDLRRRFDLFCKVCPLIVFDELAGEGHLHASHVRGVDILVLRENASGIYQGEWSEESGPDGERIARHSFAYGEREVRRILEVGAHAARRRRGRLAIALKDHGLPTISALWRESLEAVSEKYGVEGTALDIDYAAYQILNDARRLDVVVAGNLFGDILSDVGGLLVGSRGLGYSASFSGNGGAVYQTNHGAAYDLVGTDRSNPVGQILSLAMMLRESFGLHDEADLITDAVRDVWRQGYRTADQACDGAPSIGTRAMTDRIVEAVGLRAAATPRAT
jgi:3-isopropylmalate dehydrogenase